MIQLGARLLAISAFVERGSILADVGADHGKVLIYLAKRGIISKGYGIENKTGPFGILSNNLKASGGISLTPIFESGIANLPEDVDTLILAGLGGDKIVSILTEESQRLCHIETIIVDAHTARDEVRRKIVALGYLIADESLVEERGIYYSIIKFAKSPLQMPYSNLEYAYGPSIIHSPLFKKYASMRLAKIDDLLKSPLPEDARKRLHSEKEMLNHYEN